MSYYRYPPAFSNTTSAALSGTGTVNALTYSSTDMSVDGSGNFIVTFRDGAGNGVYKMTYSGTGVVIAAPSVGSYLTPDAPGYDVIVIAGQSNGVGWATGSFTTANSNVFALTATNTAAVAATDLLPQDSTIATSNGLPSNYVSNGKGFGSRMVTSTMATCEPIEKFCWCRLRLAQRVSTAAVGQARRPQRVAQLT